MARETKVGLLIGVGVILLIAIIVNDALVATHTAEGPEQLTEFATAAQEELTQETIAPTPPTRQADASRLSDQIVERQTAGSPSTESARRSSPLIPTAEELDTPAWQSHRRELPPRSAQGLHAAARVDAVTSLENQLGALDANQMPSPQHPARIPDQVVQHAVPEYQERVAFTERAEPLPDPARQSPEGPSRLSLRHDPPSNAEIIHYVKPNEALWDIAERYLGDGSKWKLIAEANKGQVGSKGRVNAGARLVIPSQVAVIAAANQRVQIGGQPIDVTPRGGQMPTLYTVKAGDNLSKIAATTLGNADRWREIHDLNRDRLPNANDVKQGMKLKIPTREAAAQAPAAGQHETAAPNRATPATTHRSSYTVKPGDNLSKIAAATLGDAGRWREIHDLNRDRLPDANKVKQGMKLKIPG